MNDSRASRLAAAERSLDGLSVGDALGERFFGPPEVVIPLIQARALPRVPWRWTDDTAMAVGIVEVLVRFGRIDQDDLARTFVRNFAAEPDRGYGPGARQLLYDIARGDTWRAAASSAFDGQGSMGNGGAMRVAPVGAYFSDDLERVVVEATASAAVTHAHREGQAGAIAVAVAAAVAQQGGAGAALLTEAIARTPEGRTRGGLRSALELPLSTSPEDAAAQLGSGQSIVSSDTVPFALWCAARHGDEFEEAFWTTVAGLGDRDTTCAIVGGIVALSTKRPIPAGWLASREPLPPISVA